MPHTSVIPSLTLSNGVAMPALGLGTYRLKGEACRRAVKDAILEGYRLIDTAAVYKTKVKNEEDIGAVIHELLQAGVVRREELFITTKIAPRDQGEEKAYAAALESLRKLGPSVGCTETLTCTLPVHNSLTTPTTTDIDLLLIHWPGTQGLPITSPQNASNRHGTYRALERLHAEQKARAIGVSNFTIPHLQSLLAVCTIPPHVNQFEFHPLLYATQAELVAFCGRHGIQMQAYSSFGEGRLVGLEEGRMVVEGVEEVLRRKGADRGGGAVTRAQVLLKWGMERCGGVVPKASNRERLRENLGSVDVKLSPEELDLIDRATEGSEDVRFCWDPNAVL
ncbi:hypothetical protein HDV00_000549 [Rhizophlyctis rosea]|nr:hypothetical protein HDV00_000549 [Rhizophlyctis rosea]